MLRKHDGTGERGIALEGQFANSPRFFSPLLFLRRAIAFLSRLLGCSGPYQLSA